MAKELTEIFIYSIDSGTLDIFKYQVASIASALWLSSEPELRNTHTS